MNNTQLSFFGERAKYCNPVLNDTNKEHFKKLIRGILKDSFVNGNINPYIASLDLAELIQEAQAELARDLRTRYDCLVDARINIDLSWKPHREMIAE